MTTGKIFVVSAPSGAGKNTLLDHLKATVPNLVYSISATTRKPRSGEVDGVHYFFLSVEEFKARITQGAFAEWAEVFDNYYGTPRAFIDTTIAAGSHIIMDIDVQGKVQFDTVYPHAVGILIVPPSMAALRDRLTKRGTDSPEVISGRLKKAQEELIFARTKGKYEHTVINDDLVRAQNEFVEIVRKYVAAK